MGKHRFYSLGVIAYQLLTGKPFRSSRDFLPGAAIYLPNKFKSWRYRSPGRIMNLLNMIVAERSNVYGI